MAPGCAASCRAENFYESGLTAAQSSQTRNKGYSVVSEQGRDWIVDPAGRRFLSFGVCVVDAGSPFLAYDPTNPSYAAFQHYPTPQAWAADTVDRLGKWGFNTIGAWSQTDALRAAPNNKLYFMPILHMGSSAGAPWKDMWDPEVVNLMDAVARDQIKPIADDPRVVGFFSDNEMGWWEGALFDWAWKSAGTRAHLVQLLSARYQTWPALLADFDPEGADSFESLAKSGRLYLRAGGNGMGAVQAYMGVLADRYYSLCRASIKRYDTNGLFLGDRYISNFYPEVASAAAKYVDILSTNLNGDWNDGSFTRSYLPDLELITQKPILISEYYESATENASGNKNDSSGFPVVRTQAERATRFSQSTSYLFRQPYVVGAHWFQYTDEPKNGRGDGENYNFGLVDIRNQPYHDLVRASAALGPNALHEKGPVMLADATSGVPPAPERPSDLEAWNRDRGFVAPTSMFPRGDLYLSWSGSRVYAAFYWNEDRFDEAFYRGGKVPAEELGVATLQIDGKTATGTASEEDGDHGELPGAFNHRRGVRQTMILSVDLGRTLHAGDSINLDARVVTRGRAYTGAWKGAFTLAGAK